MLIGVTRNVFFSVGSPWVCSSEEDLDVPKCVYTGACMCQGRGRGLCVFSEMWVCVHQAVLVCVTRCVCVCQGGRVSVRLRMYLSLLKYLGALCPWDPKDLTRPPPLHHSRCRCKAVAEGIDTSLKIQGLLVNRNF